MGDWVLGTVADENIVVATVEGLDPIKFTARAAPGAAARLIITSGEQRRDTIEAFLPESLTVEARDQYDNVMGAGIPIVFAAPPDAGTLSTSAVETNAQGRASVQWRLGTTTGTRSVEAALGADGSVTATFTAQVDPGRPASLESLASATDTVAVGSQVTTPPSVRVRDRHGNPVGGATVEFAITEGEGVLQIATATSTAVGIAGVESWTLESAGNHSLSAHLEGVEPITFRAVAHTPAGGILSSSTTWTATGSPYRLTENVQIAYGTTLAIEPGVEVQGQGRAIEVWGTLDAKGSSGATIGFSNTAIIPRGRSTEHFQIRIRHAAIQGGSFYAPAGAIYGTVHLSDSQLRGGSFYIYLWYPVEDCYLERNIFEGVRVSTGHRDGVTVYVRNNLFLSGLVENWASYDSSQTIVEYNSFMSTGSIAAMLPPAYDAASLTAINNYWGTSEDSVIQAMIYDRNDDLNSAGIIPYLPYLTQPDPLTPPVP